MVKQLTLKISTKGVFNPVYVPHINNQHRVQIFFGGSSSGKSVFKADNCVLDVIKGRNYLICRKTGNTLRKSTFNEIKKSISKFKLGAHFDINKSEMVVTFIPTRTQILFAGLDDVEKIKSITPEKGVLTDIWIEEATETGYNDIKQLEKRLRGKSKFAKRLHLSFNPILKTHWIYKEYFVDFWIEGQSYVEKPGLSILKTTFNDNDFLEEDDKAALRDEPDRYYREVYSYGNWGVLGHVIFKNWEVKEFDEEHFDNYFNGVDWGWVHPFAFIRVHYDKERAKVYICNEICQKELGNKESAKLLKPIVSREIVTCDSAEPKSVSEYSQLGITALGAKKGKGSIEHGIKFLQGLKIIIHPRCQAFINEIQTYQWQEDKDGNALPKPIDKDDDLLDALRYALERESFSDPLPAPAKTVDDLKKMDMFSEDFEALEDELEVTYDGSYINIEDDGSDSVVGY
ncbi:PBSX family phage terminase large subunit [Candidatus Babeliales bacterium]|nr:PBSX family phage terminase large subunit [Candidatus Babeliales bacterium]